MGEFVIEALGSSDQHKLGQFKLDHEDHLPLKIFIRSQARKSAAQFLTQTYVAKRESDGRIVGFVSLMCADVKLDPAIAGNRYTLQPAIRVARLATEDGCRGSGVGTTLLDWAIATALVRIQPVVGCRFLIVDAKQDSIAFYERNGFRQIDTDENRRRPEPAMFLDLKPHA